MDKKELREHANQLHQESNLKLIGFESMENPLIEEVEDSDLIQKFFETEKLIPYAGTNYSSGHSLLRYYDTMSVLSPTSYSIMNSKSNTSFSGRPHLVLNDDDIFSEDAIIEDKQVYKDISFIVSSIGFDRGKSINDLPEQIHEGVFKNGNAYIEVVLGSVLREKVAALYVHKQRNVLYNLDPKEYSNLVSISPLWDSAYLKKYKPAEIPIFPEFKQYEDGTIRTIIHVKRGGSKYYGRPRNEGCFYELFREHQISEYLVKQTANEFTGRLILEVEDADTRTNRMIDNTRDQKAGYKSTFDRFEQNYTAKSKNPRSFLMMSRPYGARAMAVHQVQPMTNENFYKITSDLAEKSIIKVHAWNKRLLGDDAASGLSSNIILDAYKLVDNTEVPNIQSIVLKAQNLALKIIYDWFGRQDLMKYSFAYKLKSKTLEENANNTDIVRSQAS